MHHKFLVLDDRVYSGSFNWTKQASRANSENLCVLPDPGLVGAFGREFLRLWAEFGGRRGRLPDEVPKLKRRRERTPPVRGGGGWPGASADGGCCPQDRRPLE